MAEYYFDSSDKGSLEIKTSETKRCFYREKNNLGINFSTNGLNRIGDDASPIFFYEWQKIEYLYLIDDSNIFTPPFKLIINDKIIHKSKQRKNNHLLSGFYSFEDQVGKTRIEIRDNLNKLIFQMDTEIFPQKMDYQSDYKTMMAEISQIIQNLSYDILKDTFSFARPRMTGFTTANEWWNILDALFEQLIISIGIIKRQPKHEIKISENIRPIEKIKKGSKKNRNWFRKNLHYSNTSGMGIQVHGDKYFTNAISLEKYVSYDTYENRFVCWAIKNTIHRLNEFNKFIEISYSDHNRHSQLVRTIRSYQGRLQGFLHESPFNEVSEFEKKSFFSTTLTRGTGYRDFLKIYQLLVKGLELAENEIFKIDLKNISTLYEYWCFLKLVQLIKENQDISIDFQDIIKIRANKFHVELEKGKSSEIKLADKENKNIVALYYNKEFQRDGNKIFTFNQRPDISVEFRKNDYQNSFWYLFDAKYRFDENTDNEKNEYNVPQDAIGQMHRYRDAILHTNPQNSTYRSAIKSLGGIILYPYPLSEEQFKNNTFYKSIEHVNIGALPFLPDKTYLVDKLLNKMIYKSLPEEHFEKYIDMDYSEYRKHRSEWKKWITIGVIPREHQKERIKFLKDNQIFYVPFVKNLHSRIYRSKKILLCKSGTRNAMLFDVIDWEILTDKELIKLGTAWTHRFEKYLVFHLDHIKDIRTPEIIAPINYRYTTEKGLNLYLNEQNPDKKVFYLTNPDAARLYLELVNRSISFKVKWVDNKHDPSLMKFIFNSKTVFSSDTYPDLHFKFNGKIIALNILPF